MSVQNINPFFPFSCAAYTKEKKDRKSEQNITLNFFHTGRGNKFNSDLAVRSTSGKSFICWKIRSASHVSVTLPWHWKESTSVQLVLKSCRCHIPTPFNLRPSSPFLTPPFLSLPPFPPYFWFHVSCWLWKWIADYFRNKYLDMENAWWGKAGLNCCATVSMQGRSRTVIAVSWTNCIFYAIKSNLFVDLEMQQTHILMDSSFLSVGFPDLLSLFVWRSNPEDTALKMQTKRKQRRRGKRMSVIWEDLAWDKDRT